MKLFLRSPIYKGRVEACGIYFPQIPESRLMSAVISLWDNGISLYRIDKGHILLLQREISQDCATFSGYPLVRQRQAISTAPLSHDILETENGDSESIFVVLENQIHHYRLSETEQVDLSAWVDISNFQIEDVLHLGCELPAPLQAEEHEEISKRSIFGEQKYGTTEEANEFVDSLKDGFKQNYEKSDGFFSSFSSSGFKIDSSVWMFLLALAFLSVLQSDTSLSWQRVIVGFLVGAIIYLLFFHGRTAGPRPVIGEGTQEVNLRGESTVRTNEASAPKKSRFKSALSKWIMSSQLGKVLGKRQAKYLKKVHEMFENGDFDEALKHAVPLGRMRDVFEPLQDYSMGIPGPRSDLSIQTQKRSQSSISVGNDYEDYLRRTYQKAFEKLDRDKRYRDAAFVKAELLMQEEEAVAYLEKHGEKRLAAELAEGRLLRPELVIRQWIVEGDIDRAILIARQTNCYEKAILLLSNDHRELADDLRMRWATLLASSGNYGDAIEAIWPLEENRKLAREWIDKVVDWGGEKGAQLLAKKVSLTEELTNELLEKISELGAARDNQSHFQREAFISELLSVGSTGSIKHAANLMIRPFIADAANGHIAWDQRRLKSLARLADDPVITEDWGNLKVVAAERELLCEVKEPITAMVELNGFSETRDCRELPNGKFLFAHGEAGVTLRRSDGSVQRNMRVSCDHLVVSDNGNRAIAVAKRGDICKLTKLDLETGAIQAWVEAKLTSMSPSYDGEQWLVGIEDSLVVLDTMASDLRSVWQINELPGQVIRISRANNSVSVLLQGEAHLEYWRYKLPHLTLKERTPIEKNTIEHFDFYDLSEQGTLVYLRSTEQDEKCVAGLRTPMAPGYELELELNDWSPLSISHFEDWSLVTFIRNGTARIDLIDVNQNRLGKVRLSLEVKSEANMRFSIYQNRLFLCSANGVALTVDLSTGHILDKVNL